MSAKPKKRAPQLVHLTKDSIVLLAQEVGTVISKVMQEAGGPANDSPLPAAAASKSAKFTKLDANGKELPDAATHFAAVRINSLGLIVAKVQPHRGAHKSCEQFAAGLTHMGKKDWRLPTRLELLNGIWDETKHNPAYDPTFWSWLPINDWYWTGTAFAGGSGYAWGVYLSLGDSSGGNRNSSGYALAVRGAPSQS